MTPMPHMHSSAAPLSYYTQSLDALFKGPAAIEQAILDQTIARLSPIIEHLRQRTQPHAAAIFRSAAATADLPEIAATATRLRDSCRAVLVIGAGGSSLSGKVLSMLPRTPDGKTPHLHFIDTIDPAALDALVSWLKLEETGIVAISKSGATVETISLLAALFRHARERGVDLAPRCVGISVAGENPLRTLAKEYGFAVLEHDPELCGRFSLFSSVGLLPAAIAGLDFRALRAGAASTFDALQQHKAASPAAAPLGAAAQFLLMEKGYGISVLMAYGEALSGLAWWHRQSWAESLGKEGKGSTPHASFGPSDQHSQLQLYLEGPQDKLFTLLIPQTRGQGMKISGLSGPLDFLQEHTLGDVMQAEAEATYETLVNAGRPVRLLQVPHVDEAALGAIYAHWMLEIILTAALLEVNPFDQPAVEESKRLARASLSKS